MSQRILECEVDWFALQAEFDTDGVGRPQTYPCIAVINGDAVHRIVEVSRCY